MELKKTFCRKCRCEVIAASVPGTRDDKDYSRDHADVLCIRCYSQYHTPKTPIQKFLYRRSAGFSFHNISSLFNSTYSAR